MTHNYLVMEQHHDLAPFTQLAVAVADLVEVPSLVYLAVQVVVQVLALVQRRMVVLA